MTHKGWHSRNYLPHFDSQDVVQFVTFRLADSLPKAALARLGDDTQPESLRHEMLEHGWGACWLRSAPIANLVEDAFLTFDGSRYRLHAWTVMPEPCARLVYGPSRTSAGSNRQLVETVHRSKSQRQLGRSGAFWQTEYWDRFIRSETHFSAIEDYIDNNPVKAGLVSEPRLWPYGSARLTA